MDDSIANDKWRFVAHSYVYMFGKYSSVLRGNVDPATLLLRQGCTSMDRLRQSLDYDLCGSRTTQSERMKRQEAPYGTNAGRSRAELHA